LRFAFNPSLRRIANRLPPNERVKPKAFRKTGGSWNVKVSDADALLLLRRVANGESLADVASSASLNENTLRQWYEGINRPALRQQLDREFRA
jgi:hypothetical protein